MLLRDQTLGAPRDQRDTWLTAQETAGEPQRGTRHLVPPAACISHGAGPDYPGHEGLGPATEPRGVTKATTLVLTCPPGFPVTSKKARCKHRATPTRHSAIGRPLPGAHCRPGRAVGSESHQARDRVGGCDAVCTTYEKHRDADLQFSEGRWENPFRPTQPRKTRSAPPHENTPHTTVFAS